MAKSGQLHFTKFLMVFLAITTEINQVFTAFIGNIKYYSYENKIQFQTSPNYFY